MSSKRADRLQFHNNLAFDEKIQSVFADLVVAIKHRHRLLPHEPRFH